MSYNPLAEFTPDQLRVELARRSALQEPEPGEPGPPIVTLFPGWSAITPPQEAMSSNGINIIHNRVGGWDGTVTDTFGYAVNQVTGFLGLQGDGPVAAIVYAKDDAGVIRRYDGKLLGADNETLVFGAGVTVPLDNVLSLHL